MAARRDADCPLCGARLHAAQVLDACEDLLDAAAGVVAGRCPFCQGYFEVQPESGVLHLGYLSHGRFEAVRSLPSEGLTVLRVVGSGTLTVSLDGRQWRFGEPD